MEDILAHIPCSRVLEFKSRAIIYDEGQSLSHLYLVIAGMVKVTRISASRRELIVDIYRTDEFFGLSGFVTSGPCAERATALKTVHLMKWSVQELTGIIERQPRLGIALLQMSVQRLMEHEDRVSSYSLDTIPCRLARSLLYLADRFGVQGRDGTIQMTSFTHLLLSEFLGTSRAMVSKCMSRLQRGGYVKYSRRGMTLYRDALERWIEAGQHGSLCMPGDRQAYPTRTAS
jgi:CRP-like cAMP-binding protein